MARNSVVEGNRETGRESWVYRPVIFAGDVSFTALNASEALNLIYRVSNGRNEHHHSCCRLTTYNPTIEMHYMVW